MIAGSGIISSRNASGNAQDPQVLPAEEEQHRAGEDADDRDARQEQLRAQHARERTTRLPATTDQTEPARLHGGPQAFARAPRRNTAAIGTMRKPCE